MLGEEERKEEECDGDGWTAGWMDGWLMGSSAAAAAAAGLCIHSASGEGPRESERGRSSTATSIYNEEGDR